MSLAVSLSSPLLQALSHCAGIVHLILHERKTKRSSEHNQFKKRMERSLEFNDSFQGGHCEVNNGLSVNWYREFYCKPIKF